MRERLALHLAGATVAAVILAPLAASGYVLSFDMNFVPQQQLRWDLLAPTDSAPRAVPLDAAVSLVNLVIPGWLLQRLVLVGIVWAAVVGAGRLVPTRRLAVRLIAAVGYGWTPFLAERLLLGQWGLLIAYAALPWLVAACFAVRSQRRTALPQLVLALALSALTPSGGLIAAIVALTLLAGIGWRRFTLAAVAVVLVNSPWLVAALASTASSRSDPLGVAAFAARGENWSGPIGALLGTGGIWNRLTTPGSREHVIVPVVTLLLLALAGLGVPALLRRLPAGQGWRLLALALGGVAVAALGTVTVGADLLRWLIEYVPGAGLLRDGQKFVLPYALILVLAIALGAERLAARLPVEAGRVALAGVLLLPLFAMPDLAWGGAGALRPVHYPRDWPAVAELVRDEPGEVLSLPLAEYRAYPWNHDRVVLDPAPRYLPAPVLIDDTLVVGDLVVRGESPRMAGLRELVAAGGSLRDSGVRWVLVQHRGPDDRAVPAALVAGMQLRYQGDFLTLYRSPGPVAAPAGAASGWPVLVAELVMLAVVLVAGVLVVAGQTRRRSSWNQLT